MELHVERVNDLGRPGARFAADLPRRTRLLLLQRPGTLSRLLALLSSPGDIGGTLDS